MHENQKYWADRWADQMNYPYWKDRCAAEMEEDGTTARKLFYEGTKAYKSADFPRRRREVQGRPPGLGPSSWSGTSPT